jgi:hypothetical protein
MAIERIQNSATHQEKPDSEETELLEGERIPGTESQLAEAQKTWVSINNSEFAKEQGVMNLVTEARELAKTDWAGYEKEMDRLSGMWVGARELFLKPKLEREKQLENSIQWLMSTNTLVRKQGIDQLKNLDSDAQITAAETYFNSTIGGGEMPILNSLTEQYEVYGALSGTAFGDTFRELEDARLKKYGSSGFTL